MSDELKAWAVFGPEGIKRHSNWYDEENIAWMVALEYKGTVPSEHFFNKVAECRSFGYTCEPVTIRRAALPAPVEPAPEGRELLRQCREMLALSDPDGTRAAVITTPEDPEIYELCEQIGYGAVMDSAARQWFIKDSNGALTVGSCAATIRQLVARIDALLARPAAPDAVMVPISLLNRTVAALQRHLDRDAPMRVPVEPTDSDVVQAEISMLLMGLTAAALSGRTQGVKK